MSNATATDGEMRVNVPSQTSDLVPPSPERIRALRRHLVGALRDLRVARRPDRLIQAREEPISGLAGEVIRAGCALCRGHCCRGGGTHAYIDERTMARVRTERAAMTAAAVIGLYMKSIARPGFRDSCLFHGSAGCTLPRDLRAELCNSYHCNGLKNFLKADWTGIGSVTIVNNAGQTVSIPVPTHMMGDQHPTLSPARDDPRAGRPDS